MKAVAMVPDRRERSASEPEQATPTRSDPGATPLDGTSWAAGASPVRLTRRGRGVLVMLALLVAVLLGFVGGRANASDASEPQTVSVVVRPGDTLWSFARGVAEPGEDLRDVVLELQWLNGMNSAALEAGDVIRLPA